MVSQQRLSAGQTRAKLSDARELIRDVYEHQPPESDAEDALLQAETLIEQVALLLRCELGD